MEPNNLAEKALLEVFPEKHGKYLLKTEYSGRLKEYGAYVSISGGVLRFKLSREWYAISPEIQMGLMQELMQKIFKSKGKHTMYVDLYNGFVRNLHIAIPKDENDPELEQCFNRVNDRYFLGLVERSNLRWGKFATRTFGSYNFKTDRITISSVFKEVPDPKYIDYIMFHEMLHKQRKFFKSGTKTYYHDAKFKRLENVFEGGNNIENELVTVVRKAKASAAYRTRKEEKSPVKGWRGWFG